MDFSSKDYDRIRAAARRRGRGGRSGGTTGDQATITRKCAVEGCDKPAEHRAPKGRGKEGQYFWFCLDHVREYNKTYNYFDGMEDDDVIAFQRDAITGHRPTKPIGVRGRTRKTGAGSWGQFYDDPFGLFNGDQAPREPEKKRVSTAERHAFEVLGLEPGASKEAIKARYKTLVKRHHPDANHGDRSSEDRLRSVINAYNALRRTGAC